MPFDAEERERLRRLAGLLDGADWAEVVKSPHDVTPEVGDQRTIAGPDLVTLQRAAAELSVDRWGSVTKHADGSASCNECGADLNKFFVAKQQWLGPEPKRRRSADHERLPLGAMTWEGDTATFANKVPQGCIIHGFEHGADGPVAVIERRPVPSAEEYPLDIEKAKAALRGGEPARLTTNPDSVRASDDEIRTMAAARSQPALYPVQYEKPRAWGWAPEWLRRMGAFHRLNKWLVCEFSNHHHWAEGGLVPDYHDYPDAGGVEGCRYTAAPMHGHVYTCRRCGKGFMI